MIKRIYNGWQALLNIGIYDNIDIHEKRLVRLSNWTALLILLIVNLFLLPAVLLIQHEAPILLLASLFFPFTLLFNYKRFYALARHYQLGILYLVLLLISVFRGLESGILCIAIPAMVLAFIFFQEKTHLYLHLGILIALILGIFLFSYHFAPLAPLHKYSIRFAHLLHLLMSITLTLAFLSFFFKLNRRYQLELQKLNITKSKIFSIIGHDLQAPLNSLQGVLSLLNNKHLTQEEFYSLTGSLQQSTTQLSLTLNNLLQWSVTQLNGFTSRPTRVNIYQLTKELEQLFKESALQKNINLTNQVVTETYAHCDRNQILLVLRNLINNAIKFTRAGGTILIEASEQNSQLHIQITDTGMGIPASRQEELFKATTKSQSGTQGERGTGIGLLLCKEMVEANGGTIGVSSEINKGSTFYFNLPLADKGVISTIVA